MSQIPGSSRRSSVRRCTYTRCWSSRIKAPTQSTARIRTCSHRGLYRGWQTPGMRLDRAVLFKLATNERLEQLVKGVPGGEENAWRAASRYVAGRTRDEALQVADQQLALGHGISVDLFGEMSTDPADAARVVDEYLELARVLPAPPADVWLSLDLSHLALDVDPKGAADLVARIV